MKIGIVCSSPDHPVNPYLARWIEAHSQAHDIVLARSVKELDGGDILFLISCSELVGAAARARFAATLVIHASALPLGRGWSPHIWQILEGREQITVTLLEAEDKVDSGAIWHQAVCDIPRHALWDEINHAIFEAELGLMDFAVRNFGSCRPVEQDETAVPTYYPRRGPADCALDPDRTLAEQFDLIRVSDPDRYPAFFDLFGHRYRIRIEKVEQQ